MSVRGQTKKSEGAAPKRQAKGIEKTPSTWPGLPVSKTGNPSTRDLGKVPYTRLEAMLQPRCPFQVRGRKAVFNGNLKTGARLGFNVQMSAPMQQPVRAPCVTWSLEPKPTSTTPTQRSNAPVVYATEADSLKNANLCKGCSMTTSPRGKPPYSQLKKAAR